MKSVIFLNIDEEHKRMIKEWLADVAQDEQESFTDDTLKTMTWRELASLDLNHLAPDDAAIILRMRLLQGMGNFNDSTFEIYLKRAKTRVYNGKKK